MNGTAGPNAALETDQETPRARLAPQTERLSEPVRLATAVLPGAIVRENLVRESASDTPIRVLTLSAVKW